VHQSHPSRPESSNKKPMPTTAHPYIRTCAEDDFVHPGQKKPPRLQKLNRSFSSYHFAQVVKHALPNSKEFKGRSYRCGKRNITASMIHQCHEETGMS